MNKFKRFCRKIFSGISIYNLLFAFLGGVLLAFVMRNIHEISPITEGGMIGLVLLIDHWLHISPSITTPIINIICYLFAFKVLGKNFIFNSAFAIIGFSSFHAIFEQFPPIWPEIANMPIVASILGGLGIGISCGICVLASSAPTADDAIALALKSKTKLKITTIYIVSDLTVLLLSLTYIPFKLILYSLLTVFISTQVIGLMQKLFDKRKEKRATKMLQLSSESEEL